MSSDRIEPPAILMRLYVATMHAMLFIAGLRVLAQPSQTRTDVMLLLVMCVLLVALIGLYSRQPQKFGPYPDVALQVLLHGAAICMSAALAAAIATALHKAWMSRVVTCVVSALGAGSLAAIYRTRKSMAIGYGRWALASSALMSAAAALMQRFIP